MSDKMNYIEALDVYQPSFGDTSLFLGGGISNCADWQSQVKEFLGSYSGFKNFYVLNPRRANFPMDDPNASTAQIEWEHHHLKLSTMVIFWFPCETLCPITLFEYGKHLVGNKKLFVGCHPDYKRKIDVEVQTRLEQPNLKVHDSIESICKDILSYLRSINCWGN